MENNVFVNGWKDLTFEQIKENQVEMSMRDFDTQEVIWKIHRTPKSPSVWIGEVLTTIDVIPQTREIHWVKIPGQPGDTKERPVLAVSTDSCNQFANDILAVPRSMTLRPSPTDVYLPAGPGGISFPYNG